MFYCLFLNWNDSTNELKMCPLFYPSKRDHASCLNSLVSNVDLQTCVDFSKEDTHLISSKKSTLWLYQCSYLSKQLKQTCRSSQGTRHSTEDIYSCLPSLHQGPDSNVFRMWASALYTDFLEAPCMTWDQTDYAARQLFLGQLLGICKINLWLCSQGLILVFENSNLKFWK